MIICGFDQQIQFLASLSSFEVDMSYKRVKGEFNEVIFATFLPDHNKSELMVLELVPELDAN